MPSGSRPGLLLASPKTILLRSNTSAGMMSPPVLGYRTLDQAIYFAFIKRLSIGYGDVVPQTGWGCVVAVGIGMIGMIFIGITAAVATRALAEAVTERSKHSPSPDGC